MSKNKCICNHCGKEKEGVQTGICSHCGRFGKTNRELAMEWWNNLPNVNVHKTCKATLAQVYTERHWQSLTGREIEQIWEKENPIAALPDDQINTDFKGLDNEVYPEYVRNTPNVTPELVAILKSCYKAGVDTVTFPAGSWKEEDLLFEISDIENQYVIVFHRSGINPMDFPYLKTKSTNKPIWKDWYMTINYHA